VEALCQSSLVVMETDIHSACRDIIIYQPVEDRGLSWPVCAGCGGVVSVIIGRHGDSYSLCMS